MIILIKKYYDLENLVRTSIEPRIIGVFFHPFKLSNEKYLILTYIPKSFNPPHVVNYQGHWKFYSRNSKGKYPMDLGEVRNSISLSDSLSDKIRNFQLERISRIISNDISIPLVDDPKMIVHLIPLISFDKGSRIDLSSYVDNYSKLKPLFDSASFQRFNLDGLIVYSATSDHLTSDAYSILFHNGIIESLNGRVLSFYGRNKKAFPIRAIQEGLFNHVESYLEQLNSLGIFSPIVLYVTFLGIKGYSFDSNDPFFYVGQPVDRENLFLPEVIINDYEENISKILRPVLDSLWQSFGYSKCRDYDENGEWLLNK